MSVCVCGALLEIRDARDEKTADSAAFHPAVQMGNGRFAPSGKSAGVGNAHSTNTHSATSERRSWKSLPSDDLCGVCASNARDLQMSPAGFEPTTYGLKVPGKAPQYSGSALAQCDPELQRLIDSWPRLSPQLRDAIYRLIAAID